MLLLQPPQLRAQVRLVFSRHGTHSPRREPRRGSAGRGRQTSDYYDVLLNCIQVAGIRLKLRPATILLHRPREGLFADAPRRCKLFASGEKGEALHVEPDPLGGIGNASQGA